VHVLVGQRAIGDVPPPARGIPLDAHHPSIVPTRTCLEGAAARYIVGPPCERVIAMRASLGAVDEDSAPRPFTCQDRQDRIRAPYGNRKESS
jgi:hypothetical protein